MINKNDIPEGYTAKELGIFPEEWQIVAISDIAENMRAGGTPSRKNPEYWGGIIPFVLIEDMTSVNLFLDKTKETINEAGLQNSSAWIVPPNSLLLSMYATIGATAINTIPMATNQAILAIIPKSNFDIIFGAYSLQFHSQRLASQNVQSTQKNVNKGIVSSFIIPLPPLPEQHAIAAILRTVQEAKEKTDAIIAATKALKAAMMKHLFTYGPVLPEEAERVALKETEIGSVPEEWEIKKVGEYCLSSAFGPRFSNSMYDVNGNIALLRTTDLDNDGNISYSTMPKAKLELEQFKNHFLLPNDLVISRSGTCGIAAVFSNYEIPVLPGAFLIRFRLSNQINPVFLKYYINSIAGQARISQLADGAIQKNISGKKILNFSIPVPPQNTQNQILSILSIVDQKLAAEQSHKEALDTLFTSLLHDLMTAKVRVNPAETV